MTDTDLRREVALQLLDELAAGKHAASQDSHNLVDVDVIDNRLADAYLTHPATSQSRSTASTYGASAAHCESMTGVNAPVVAARGRLLAYAVVIQGVARASQLVSAAFGSALIAHRRSAELLATFGLALLMQTIVQTVGDWGLSAIGTQALARNEPGVTSGRLTRLRSTIQVPFAALAAIACVILWVEGRDLTAAGIAAGVAAGSVTNIAAGATSSFQVDLRLDVPSWIDIVCRLAGFGALVPLILSGAPDWAVVTTLPATAVADLALTMWAARRAHYSMWDTPGRGVERRLLRQATPLMTLTVCGVLYMRAASFVVLGLHGMTSFGAYSLIFRVVDVLVLIPSLPLSVIFPILVRAHATDVESYRTSCQRANDGLIGLGVALVLVIELAAKPLAHIIGGPYGATLLSPMRLLTLAGLAGFTNALFAQLCIIEGLQRVILRLSIGALLVNVILAVVLVEIDGLTGAAGASAITEVGGAVLVAAVVCRRAAL
ncbi:MAG TPA: hypothetical protein VHW74_02545, partial [Mycobacteriales bacterium]|nr:hypothetical protein [Mycobacteriales bacterium]